MAAGTTDRISSTLPTRATGFVGRRRELARLEAVLGDARLVTGRLTLTHMVSPCARHAAQLPIAWPSTTSVRSSSNPEVAAN